MALKDILVQVDDTRGHPSRIALAADIAARCGAHLHRLFVVDTISFSALAAPGGPDFAAADAFRVIQDQYRSARFEIADRLAALFSDAADRAGVNSEWRTAEDDPASAVALQARYVDLAILGQADPDNPPAGADIVETALLNSGRPVLVVPFIGADSVGRRALVAWNATREAARAVNDALPAPRPCRERHGAVDQPRARHCRDGDVPAADIALHLARHGVTAEAAYTVAEDIGVGDLILSRAAELGADLIVMGGYGHSRAREFVLGGATRTLLQEMTVPVLLSH